MRIRLSEVTLALFALATVCYFLSWSGASMGLGVLGMAFEAMSWVSFIQRDDRRDEEVESAEDEQR